MFNHLVSGTVTLALALGPLSMALASTGATTAKAHERSFDFSYTATVRDIPATSKHVDVWIPVPHDTEFQTITRLEIASPYPYTLETAEFGNTIAHIGIDNPSEPSFDVTMTFSAVRREHAETRLAEFTPAARPEAVEPDLERWLEADRLVPIDDNIRRWASEVVTAAGATNDLERARAIYNHVVATVKYDKSGQGWGRGDIYYACDVRRGNCTDFHAIFIGYCRAVGIPARFTIGFPLPGDRGAGTISGYHCWAEFYLRGVGWVPVDASEAAKNPDRREYFFGHHDENRVAFSVGRDLELAPRQQGPPLNFFVYPYAEVDGRPFASIDRTFRYRDHSDTARTTRSSVSPASP